jgi:hypothetical protein
MYFLFCKFNAFLDRASTSFQDGGVHIVQNDQEVNYILTIYLKYSIFLLPLYDSEKKYQLLPYTAPTTWSCNTDTFRVTRELSFTYHLNVL